MTIETIREFLGWCIVINLSVFVLSLLKLLLIRDWGSEIHSKMFRIDEESVRRVYFQFLVTYKIVIIVFNLVPYIALRIMA